MPADPVRQTAFPGRTSDPGGPGPPAGDKVGWMMALEEEWEELEEMVLRPEGEKGQDEEEEENVSFL